MIFRLPLLACLIMFVLSASSSASDLTLHLAGNESFSHSLVQVECDANGVKMGAPSGPFSVEYINGGGNSLAIVPIEGKSLIFVNVVAGSGARYVAKQYTWWDAAGRGISFTTDSLAGKMRSSCHHLSSAK